MLLRAAGSRRAVPMNSAGRSLDVSSTSRCSFTPGAGAGPTLSLPHGPGSEPRHPRSPGKQLTLYVLIPHFLTMSNFSTAMPRTTSSPPTAGLGWGWCSPEPATDTAPHGTSSAVWQRPQRAQARLLPQKQQRLCSGALRLRPEGSGHCQEHRTPTGLHRGSTKPTHNRRAVWAAPTPARLCPAWEAATAPAAAQCRAPRGSGRSSSPPQQLSPAAARVRASSAKGSSRPRSAACQLAGVVTRCPVHAAGNPLPRALPEGSHAGPWQRRQPTPQDKALSPACPWELAGTGPGAASALAQTPLLSPTGSQCLLCCTALLAALSSVLTERAREGDWQHPGEAHAWAPRCRNDLPQPGTTGVSPSSHPGPWQHRPLPQHQDRDPAAAAWGGECREVLPPAAAGLPACTPVAVWGCSHCSAEVLRGTPALTRHPDLG